MTIIQKTDHISEAQAELIEQFKGKANFLAMIASLVQQVQDLEEAAFEVLDETTLANSVGVQLDGIGQIVGEPREGKTDDDYRAAISARIILNASSGTIAEVIAMLDALESTNDITVTEYFPAAFTAEYLLPLVGDGETFASLLNSIRPAAVRGQLVWHTITDTFQFSSTASSETDATKGFSNAAQTTGGQFASASEG